MFPAFRKTDDMKISVPQALALGTIVGLCLYVVRKQHGSFSFEGQVVVITGGSRGLGLEMARQWCREGARVAICARTARDVDQAVKELGRYGEAMGAVCDVTQSQQVNDFVAAVRKRWGAIDVLVNNAGIIQVGPYDSISHEDYEQALATHLWGPILMTEAVLPLMRRQGTGRIVNISSIGGRVSTPHLLPYCASKFALVGWSEGLAASLRRENIRVTTVTPGLMRTGSPRNATFKGRHREEYAWFSVGASLPIVATPSDLAAQRIIEGCRRGDATMMVSAFSSLASHCHGVAPGLMTQLMGLINDWLPSPGPYAKRAFKGYESESIYSPSWLTALNERAARRNHEV